MQFAAMLRSVNYLVLVAVTPANQSQLACTMCDIAHTILHMLSQDMVWLNCVFSHDCCAAHGTEPVA